ncbi:Glyoxalase/Bleomycin resistance protein/Dioxygenase superfamily protein [Variovorax sp. YR752]|uniref:VOC family protein n=1 Tax=unclassified Variovorax TaxID=663243 RepID=UPI000BC78011|nr:VOC family protein [Variovorax sp. YR752]SOE06176.1 Glyoxalase/Bleomycin resistance protein/Dioxygenase superfamily protein [Variovorax sp. YR752]
MEIGASLAALELYSSDPAAIASFYAKTFCLSCDPTGGSIDCHADGRRLKVFAGQAGQLRRAVFRFHSRSDFDAHRRLLSTRGIQVSEPGASHYTVSDPDGRWITFLAPEVDRPMPPGDSLLRARLQHFALRSPTPTKLVEFFVDDLGFVLSDRVLDAQGDLTAAFMRTDSEHHSLAIFRAPQASFDHFSCEAPDWQQLRDWADHMARTGTDLAWGIGRHGPGNDTFLMVRDPDGNMGEISAELEVCRPGRPAGVWPHRPQTLNQWGVAIMRS